MQLAIGLLWAIMAGWMVLLFSFYFSAAAPQSDEEMKANVSPPQAAGPSLQPGGRRVPKLEALMQRLRDALWVYQMGYRQELAEAIESPQCFSDPEDGFLAGCALECATFKSLERAQAACGQEPNCYGITLGGGGFELRGSSALFPSPASERSWRKVPCGGLLNSPDWGPGRWLDPTPAAVWGTFHETLEAALGDPALGLDEALGPAREDGSIFVSIAAYRDTACSATLARAFGRAAKPERVSVGLVQMACAEQRGCYTGEGWGPTRRWVRQTGPDPDCAALFCESRLGRPHCEAGRLRVLKLAEAESLGPFFSRFLASKLWRGENYYMQLDSHMDFRKDWDLTAVRDLRRTPSYPRSVISHYPPSGSPYSKEPWPAPMEPEEEPPSGLCSCDFEKVEERYTVRFTPTERHFAVRNESDWRPRHTGFVAAGYIFAHASLLEAVPFDPFLPFIFMGEEISMSIRFWTAGFDIYAPSSSVVSHEYGREEAPKYWESLNMIYGKGDMHNGLSALLLPRVQRLVGFPEALGADAVEPASLLERLDQFGIGRARRAEDFIGMMQIDLERKTQATPSWCLRGEPPPLMASQEHTRRDQDTSALLARMKAGAVSV